MVYKKVSIILVSSIIALFVWLVPVSFASESPHILILHSYHRGYKWTDDITSGIRSIIGATDYVLHFEYMDTKRFEGEEYFELLYGLLSYKYGAIRPEIIISSDDNAFNFMLEHREHISSSTPLVFCGVNYLDPGRLDGQKLITGINETVDIGANINLILKLHPNTRKIYMISDETITGKKMKEEFAKIASASKPGIKYEANREMGMEELERKVASLQPGTAVLYTIYSKDKNGIFYEYDESVSRLSLKSKVPFYGVWDFSLGKGIIGGMLTSGYLQGQQAAMTAKRILDGEGADTIPVVMKSPNKYMFDQVQLDRFGINTENLPSESEIINGSKSFFSRYKLAISLISLTSMVLFSLIAVLEIAYIKKKKVEKAILGHQQELDLEIMGKTKELESSNDNLRSEISEGKKIRTELEGKIKEMEVMNKLIVSRELKMIELKEKIKNLEQKK